MTFMYPALLWGLLLGAIPIIIYYLMRFRSLQVEWGAIYVLERALARLRKKLYLDQIILLTLRVLAVMALVAAFARPVARTRAGAVTDTDVHRVILVDISYSMLASETDGRSVLDTGRDILSSLAGTWGRGIRWSLCTAGHSVEWPVRDAVVDSPAGVIETLATIQAEEAASSLAAALESVRAHSGGGPTEVYLLADRQASAWRDVLSSSIVNDANFRFFWIDPGAELDSENLAVTAVRVSHERLLAGHSTRVFARVRNFGRQPAQDVPVTFLRNGQQTGQSRLSLLPGQSGWIHADVGFEEAGSHYVTARLPRDVLPFDNAYSAGVEVADSLAVRVLRDADATGKFDSAHGFIRLLGAVLARTADDRTARSTLTVLPPVAADGTADDLAAADVVIVDGGITLTPELVTLLGHYVRGGGNLVLAADERVVPGMWHRLLGGEGLLPARLGRMTAHELGNEEHFQSIARAGFQEPDLRAFETGETGDIATTRFYSWFELLDPDPGSHVAAVFGNGQPYAVIQRFSPGSVILLASGLNLLNNSLLARETGVAFTLRLLMAAAAGSQQPRTIERNAPIRLRLPEGPEPAGVQFSIEGREPLAFTVTRHAGQPVAELPGGSAVSGLGSALAVEADGRYTRTWIGIQGPRVDSDLTPLGATEQAALKAALNMERVTSWPELDAALAATRTGTERYAWAVAAMLILLLGEMAMHRRFV